MIEVRDLTKSYGDHLAVDHLNFTIEKGRIYGFLGPNGAGKSTTMNIMTGYLGATGGEVLIDGHDILKEPEEAKQCIGYLPEIPPLYMEMTVEEYLMFAAEIKKIKKRERMEQVDQVISLVKLEDVSKRLIRNLSKGYRQRVGLAQAVLGYPEIIILDEPTVGLDPQQIIEIRQLIRNLAKEHTIILSSHILAEISEVCDYILIISKGKLVASDTTKNLEALMAGAGSLELVVKGPKAQAEVILSKISGIRKAMYYHGEEPQTTKITMETEQNTDVREALFFAFAEEKCPILSMQKTKSSLEDVFLELTQKDEKEDEKDESDL